MTNEPPTNMRSRRRQDPQAGLFDVTLENPELEAALDLIEAADVAMDKALAEFVSDHLEGDKRRLNAAKKLYKETIEGVARDRGLAGDKRIRVGKFVVTTRSRAGGGFEVPEWSKVLPGKYERLDDES